MNDFYEVVVEEVPEGFVLVGPYGTLPYGPYSFREEADLSLAWVKTQQNAENFS